MELTDYPQNFESALELFRELQLSDVGDAGALDAACSRYPEVADDLRRFLKKTSPPWKEYGQPLALTPISGNRTGRRIGNYEILSSIGSGAFGDVYLAKEPKTNRRVALKVLRTPAPEMSTRFHFERTILSSFDHPNIARIFFADDDVDTGLPFFAMEYISPRTEEGKGATVESNSSNHFATFCDIQRLTIAERLRLFVSVCEAVEYSHERPIIHRDLKPSNILVDSINGKFTPKLIDFGVAKMEGNDAQHTQVGDFIGTPNYMSPEQAEGASITKYADIYSLGVILYELLTGTLPIDLSGKTLKEKIEAIINIHPPQPSERLRAIEKEFPQQLFSICADRRTGKNRLFKTTFGKLDAIVMMALRKDPQRRYSASNLGRDIQRFLAGEEVSAKRATTLEKLGQFVRRYKLQVTFCVTVVVVLILGIIGTSLGLVGANYQAEQAANARNRALTQRDIAIDAFSALALATQPHLTRKQADIQRIRHHVMGIAVGGFRKIQDANTSSAGDAPPSYSHVLAMRRQGDYLAISGRKIEAQRIYQDVAELTETHLGPTKSYLARELMIVLVRLADQHLCIPLSHTIESVPISALGTAEIVNFRAELTGDAAFVEYVGPTLAKPLAICRELEVVYARQQLLDAAEKLNRATKVWLAFRHENKNERYALANLGFLYARLADIGFHLGNTESVFKFTNKSLEIARKLLVLNSSDYAGKILQAKNKTLKAFVLAEFKNRYGEAIELVSEALNALGSIRLHPRFQKVGAPYLNDRTRLIDALNRNFEDFDWSSKKREQLAAFYASRRTILAKHGTITNTMAQEEKWRKYNSDIFFHQPSYWSLDSSYWLFNLREYQRDLKKINNNKRINRRTFNIPSLDRNLTKQLATASEAAWRQRANWGALRRDMDAREVERILGAPDRVAQMGTDDPHGIPGRTIWHFGDIFGVAAVTFDPHGVVDGWVLPKRLF